VTLDIDLVRMQSIVINLLSNALKFSSANKIIIVLPKVKELLTLDNMVELTISVVD